MSTKVTEGTKGIAGTKGAEGIKGSEEIKGAEGTRGSEGTKGREDTKGTEGTIKIESDGTRIAEVDTASLISQAFRETAAARAIPTSSRAENSYRISPVERIASNGALVIDNMSS